MLNGIGPHTGIPIDVSGCRDDNDAIFHLRYLAYLNDGHIHRSPGEQYRDMHDDSPLTLQLAGYDGERCVGSLRISFTSFFGQSGVLPCSEYFHELKRIDTRNTVEISKLAIDPVLENLSVRTTLYACLLRSALIAAEAAAAEQIVISTKSAWVRFYERMLGAKVTGKPAFYPPGDIPISMLRLPISEARRRQKLQNSFFRYDGQDIETMRCKIIVASGISAAQLSNSAA